MTISATIQWNHSKEIEDVLFWVGNTNRIKDENIFRYVDSEEELYLGFDEFEIINFGE